MTFFTLFNLLLNDPKKLFARLWVRLMIVSLLVVSACQQPEKGADNDLLERLLSKEQVGAGNMPEEIAPVNAPFDMPEFRKPEFPDLVVNIVDKGAIGEGLVTHSIQAAIDEVSESGGGKVLIPEGKWKSGRIILKSNVNLYLEEGAELYFSGELKDYRPAVFTRHEGVEVMSLGACIYAFEEDNIAITGKGTLYGPEDGPVKDQMMTEDVVENFVPLDKPVSERVYEGYNGESIFLPMFISPTKCTNVYIEGITLEKLRFGTLFLFIVMG